MSRCIKHPFFTALLFGTLAIFMMATSAHAQLLRKSFAQAQPKETEAPPAPKPPAATPESPATPATPPPATAETPAAKPVDGAPTAPSAPPAGQLLAIKISAATGNVQVRLAEAQPWQPAKAGMELSIGSEIRTGLRSVCQFTIDSNHTITLDRLGVVKVLDAIKKDGKIKTDVGMKYGRTQYQVESNAAEHDARVHAPAATLAVRGSLVTLEDNDAFGTTAVVDHSENAIYRQRGPQGSVRVVAIELIKGSIEQTPQQSGLMPPTPGQIALRETINDIGARLAKATEQERDLVAQYPIFNGAGGNGGGGLPRPREFQDPSKNVFKDIVEPGQFTLGFLDINITFNSGGNSIAFAIVDPTGAVLSTVNGFPPGANTIVRPGGTSPGSASGGTSFAHLRYDNQIAVGNYSIIAALGAVQVGASGFIGEVTRRQNAGDTGQVIREFSGTLDAANPTFHAGFGISPAVITP